MFSKRWTEDAYMSSFQQEGVKKEAAIRAFIKAYTSFIPKVREKLGLNEEEAASAFTDAVLDMVDQVQEGKFRGESKLSTYFYQIFYFKARDQFKKKKQDRIAQGIPLADTWSDPSNHGDDLATRQQVAQLKGLLDEMGDPCRQILMDWGYWGYSMQEISQRVGMETPDQAKKRKYKCLQQLRKKAAKLWNS